MEYGVWSIKNDVSSIFACRNICPNFFWPRYYRNEIKNRYILVVSVSGSQICQEAYYCVNSLCEK